MNKSSVVAGIQDLRPLNTAPHYDNTYNLFEVNNQGLLLKIILQTTVHL